MFLKTYHGGRKSRVTDCGRGFQLDIPHLGNKILFSPSSRNMLSQENLNNKQTI